MKNLDLFDNISYKYIKDIINNDEDDIEVEIEDLDCDRVAWCKTRFTFELNIDVSGGSMPIMVYKKFVVEKEYNGSSPYALMLCELDKTDDEEEEETITLMHGGINADGSKWFEIRELQKEEED